MGFFSELKRRRVVRVALVYGGVGFGVLQAADVLVPALRLPSLVTTGVAVLLILGFPLAVVLAWSFDVVPGGVRRTGAAEVSGGGLVGESRWLGHRTLLAAGIPALLGMGIGAGWFLRPVEGSAGGDGVVSVAALPFDNLSASAEDGYFADGMHDEILTQLSRIGALRVISRTSVMQYRETDRSLREIAEALNARYILEGTVRRGGDRVRVTAQLIDARDDSHVWAETYDRSLDDVLAIQSDVALRIAEALHAALTPDELRRIEDRATADQATYDMYLRALAIDQNVRADNEVAIDLYRGALALDPTFAPAWAGLGDAYADRVAIHGFPRAWADSGLAAADRAVSLDGDLAEGHSARSFNLTLLGRLREARAAGERALELAPNSPMTLDGLSWIERELGRYDVALRRSEAARRLSPNIPEPLVGLVGSLRGLGDFEGMERGARRIMEMQPTIPWSYTVLVYTDLQRGRYDSARQRAEAYRTSNPDNVVGLQLAGDVAAWERRWEDSRRHFQRLYDLAPEYRLAGVWFSGRLGLGYALHAMGREAEAAPLLERSLTDARARLDRGEEFPISHVEIALVHAIREEREQALDALERAYDAGWRHDFLPTMPHFADLAGEPRFVRLVARIESDLQTMRAGVDLPHGSPTARSSTHPTPRMAG